MKNLDFFCNFPPFALILAPYTEPTLQGHGLWPEPAGPLARKAENFAGPGITPRRRFAKKPFLFYFKEEIISMLAGDRDGKGNQQNPLRRGFIGSQ